MPHLTGTLAELAETRRRLELNRRRFIKLGLLATVAATLAPSRVIAAVDQSLRPTRSLSFFNTHTGERLDACYCKAGRYHREALKTINYILRDHRTGDVKTIDPHLLDILYALSRRLDATGPFHIISGYRSPATNALLRTRSKKVASGSFHTRGMAIDIRLPDIDTARLHRKAVKMEAGGVGYYPESDFVHLDCGPVRTW